MNHDYCRLKEVFTSLLARRVIRLSLWLLLACSMPGTALAQGNSNQKTPPRTPDKPQIAVEKNSNQKPIAAELVGTLKGRVLLPKKLQGKLNQISILVLIGPTSEGEATRSQRVFGDGSYVFDNLKPDTYFIDIDGNGCHRIHKTATVRALKTTTVNITAEGCFIP